MTLGVWRDALHIPRQADGPRLPVARQPIWTAEGHLVGHEYLYRSQEGLPAGVDHWVDERQEAATASVLTTVFSEGAPDGDRLVFVNVTRSFLTGRRTLPAPAGRLVLEVVESVQVDDEVLAGIAALRTDGYLIAIDDYTACEDQAAMLPLADFVKVDLRDLHRLPLGGLAEARRHGARLVAEYVSDLALVRHATQLGFDLLQGDVLGAAQT